MDAVLTRTGEVAAAPLRELSPPADRPPLGVFLPALARLLGERLISPHREVSPEWFRFPMP